MVMIISLVLLMTWMASLLPNIYYLALVTLGISFMIPLVNILSGFVKKEEIGLFVELVQSARKAKGQNKLGSDE
jgi:hypothetical protein